MENKIAFDLFGIWIKDAIIDNQSKLNNLQIIC